MAESEDTVRRGLAPRSERAARTVTGALVAVLAAALAGCTLDGSADGARQRGARVVSIADGDTIKVRLGGKERDVRFIGIDAPESSTVRYGAADCGGEEAKASLEDLVSPGEHVRLVVDPSQDRVDRYGRWLRYVEQGGRDLGQVQVRRGLADVYVYDESAPPRRTERYAGARARAEAAAAGVFALCGGDFHTEDDR